MDFWEFFKVLTRYVIAFGFIGGGTYWGIWSMIVLLRGKRSRSWPAVNGVVYWKGVESRVTEGEGSAIEFTPRIKYTYVVNGSEYENSQGVPFLLEEWGSKEWAEEVLRRFASDAVVVYFDSRHPAKSVLQPGVNRSYYAMLVICVLLLALGLVLVKAWKLLG